MKVIDFNISGFNEFLKEELSEFSGTNHTILVLGIAEGGIPIAEYVYEHLHKNTRNDVSLNFITSQRPSTGKKKGNVQAKKILKAIFAVTPKFILNYLRVLEHKKLSRRNLTDIERNVKFSSDINFSDYDVILLVDDAVDSGYTMKSVMDMLYEKTHPASIVRSLAVVVTQPDPVFTPDYFWLRDVLIRFPWSLDGK